MFKKEYLVLFVIIIGACLYLYLKDRDRVNYRLPEPAPIEIAEFNKIEIHRSQPEVITMEKVDGQWRISPAGYTADEAQVKKMLETLADITLTALVSDSEDYDRYDLDEKKAIQVTARSGDDKILRELTVGKQAASGNHTFVRIGEDPGVYHAGGSLNDTFDKTVDALRDKTVLSFDKETIDRVLIATAGETLQLEKQPLADEAETGAEASADITPPGEKKMVWKASDGRAVDQTVLKGMLDTLSALQCDGYLPEGVEKALENPDYTITLTGKKDYTLSLYSLAGEDKSGYAGTSSENQSVFSLSEYKANPVMQKPSDLLADTIK